MYVDFRDRNDVFSGLVARFPPSATLTYRGQAERVDVELVSGNTFDVLGVSPVLGRALTPDDDRTPGAHPVAVISYSYWQRRFAGSPAVAQSGRHHQQHAGDHRRRRAAGLCRHRRDADRPTSSCR